MEPLSLKALKENARRGRIRTSSFRSITNHNQIKEGFMNNLVRPNCGHLNGLEFKEFVIWIFLHHVLFPLY